MALFILLYFPQQKAVARGPAQVKTVLNGANLYGEDHTTVIISIPKNDHVLILEEQEKWSKVSYQNEVGYVKNAAMSRTMPSIKRIVSKNSPILRVTNNQQAQQLSTIDSNTFVQVYAHTENGFSLIQNGDLLGYVYSTVLVTPTTTKKVVNDPNGVAVRAFTDLSQPILTTIPDKTVINLFTMDNDWAYIQVGDTQGYVIASKIKAFSDTKEKYNNGVLLKNKRVALTFDDGPHKTITRQILKTLHQYDAKATFFVTGRNAERYPTILKEVVAAGHEVGNHTYNHPKLTTIPLEDAQSQIQSTNKLVESIIGQEPTLFRPPYGAYNSQIQETLEVPIIMWSVDTLDWKHGNPKKLLQNVKAQAKNGSIILMHDIHQSTADGLEDVLKYLTKQGYEFVTVSEIVN